MSTAIKRNNHRWYVCMTNSYGERVTSVEIPDGMDTALAALICNHLPAGTHNRKMRIKQAFDVCSQSGLLLKIDAMHGQQRALAAMIMAHMATSNDGHMIDPAIVEAWMRMEHPTLDSLCKNELDQLIAFAYQTARAASGELNAKMVGLL